MSEHIESPEPAFDAPAPAPSDLGERLDALDALDRPTDAPDGADPVDAPDRIPWTEHPDNPHREHYDRRPELDREVQDAYDAHGIDAETIDQIDRIDQRPSGNNCGECSRAVAETLDGHPRSAAGLEPRCEGEDLWEMERWADRPFSPEQPTDSALDALDRDLAARGDGAHAIIAGQREEGSGHFLNAARLDGRTVVIDAQDTAFVRPLDDGGRAYLHDQQLTRIQWVPIERSPHDV